MTRNLVVERDMPHPPEKIWRALTQGALIADWLMKNDFEPVVGRKFTFRIDPPLPNWNGVVEGEVLVVEPPHRLVYTWNTDGAGDMRTTVAWTLTPSAKGTLVRMEQTGFTAAQENNYRGAAMGWRRNLENLERAAGNA